MNTETAVPDRRQQTYHKPIELTPNEKFRRTAALELLKTMLLNPDVRGSLFERYLVDRSEARLAVEMADDLVRELERIK